MDGITEETERLKKAFGSGIINKKTFDAAVLDRSRRSMLAWKNASMDAFRTAFVDMNILYYQAKAVGNIFYSPIQAAMQFESTLADVKKVVDFDTPEQFQQMSRDILELSKNIPSN